jgi:thiol-disulfide isomerase/thioredoxin
MSKRARIAIAVGVLAGLQLAALGIYLAVQRAREAPRDAFPAQRVTSSERAPTITGTRASGAGVELAWPAPRMRILHFWGTWCAPCVKELPSLLAFARAMRQRGADLEIVAIAVNDDWNAVTAFFQGAVPAEVVIESDAAHKRFGVSTLPDTYLVDRAGALVERYHGARDWSTAVARQHILSRLR